MIHTDDFMFCSLQSIFSIYISIRKLSSFKRLAELVSFPKFDEEEIGSQSGLVACLRPQEPNKLCVCVCGGGDLNSEFLTLEFTCQMTWL